MGPAAVTARRRAPSSRPNRQVRQALYRAAMGHFARSIREGFYLEAITLCESMISDRIEALIAAMNPAHAKAGQLLALGHNLQQFRRLVAGNAEGTDLAMRLDAWKEARNRALHEMVKLPEGDVGDWQARRTGLDAVAREGKDLVRVLSSYVRRERKGVRDQAATEPRAN